MTHIDPRQKYLALPHDVSYQEAKRVFKSDADAHTVTLDTMMVAHHEAAHAVMRWILGLEPTRLICSEYGGICFPSNELIGPDEEILITLAGPASEAGFVPSLCDLSQSSGGDLDRVRDILGRFEYYRTLSGTTYSVEIALDFWFYETCWNIEPDLVDILGEELDDRLDLSASEVEDLIRNSGVEWKARQPSDWMPPKQCGTVSAAGPT